MPPDQLLRYKAQLEIETGHTWSWLALADGMAIDASTLRNIRFNPDRVNVGTLRKVETFLRSHGVPFTVSDYLRDASLVPVLIPA
jgi:hypothetical protein